MMLARAPRSISFRMRLRARLIRLAMLLSLAVVSTGSLAACGSTGVAPIEVGPLITVNVRGGMCMEGACDHSVILEADGRVHDAATPPKVLGRVPAATMATLTHAVQGADYAALKSKPFTGECPIAFDGQELIFEFAVGAGSQRIASCEVDIDWGHPLFVAVGIALGEWIPLPLT
jgi:hypothetical protein